MTPEEIKKSIDLVCYVRCFGIELKAHGKNEAIRGNENTQWDGFVSAGGGSSGHIYGSELVASELYGDRRACRYFLLFPQRLGHPLFYCLGNRTENHPSLSPLSVPIPESGGTSSPWQKETVSR